MSEAFEPRNDLERWLIQAQNGEMEPDAFMRELLASQVFIPIKEESENIGGFQANTKAEPISIQSDDGTPILILFTSPERAKPIQEQLPGFEGGGLLETFTWILERMGTGYGIVLNPGWDVGLEMEPDMVAQLAHLAEGQKAH